MHPSINTWFVLPRPQMNQLKQKWGDFTKWIVKQYEYENLHIEKAKITFTYYFNSRRRHDPDNLTPKFFMDGLTESGMITDDDFKHIESLTIMGGYDKENPRMEVLLERLDL